MPGPFAAGSWGGAALGLASKGIDFGLGVASSKMQYDMTRKLRRREYQDMMFSMRKAGLNPMLAMGSSPGHSAIAPPSTGGPMDLQRDVASAQESSRRTKLNDYERDLLKAQREAAISGALKADAERATAEATRDATVAEIQARVNSLNAGTAFTSGPNTAATWGLAELRGQEKGLVEARTQTEGLQQTLLSSQNLTEQQRQILVGNQADLTKFESELAQARTILVGAESDATSARARQVDLENVARQIAADYMQTGTGRALKMAGLAFDDLVSMVERVLALRPKKTSTSTGEDTTHYDQKGRVKGSSTTHRTHRSQTNK